MRPSQKPNRPRGRGSRRPGGSSGNNVNRVFESNGPEGKVRGTPQQIIDKYLSLARDAQTADNRVIAENFYQHAEHYSRLLAESVNARQEQRRDNPQPDHDRQPDTDGERSAAPNAPASQPVRADDQPRERPGRNDQRPPRESEVSGLTTIDAGSANDTSLLVDSNEMSASQPRRRRRGNGTSSSDSQAQDDSQGQAQVKAPVEAETQPE
jgi:Domain of unknown function (DUF4167)